MIDLKNRRLGLGILERVIGLIILTDAVAHLPYAEFLYGSHGILQHSTYEVRGFSFHGFYWLADTIFSREGMSSVALVVLVAVCIHQITATRRLLANVLLYFSIGVVYTRNPYFLDGSDGVISVLMPFIVLARLEELTNWLPAGERSRTFRHRLNLLQRAACLAIMVQVTIIYASTGLSKLLDPTWRDGTALFYVLQLETFHASRLNDWLVTSPVLCQAMTYATLAWEVAFAALIWFRPTRNPVLLFGVLLHLGIYLLLRIEDFSWIMIASYAVFIPDRDWVARWRKISMPSRRLAHFFTPLLLLLTLTACQAEDDVSGLVRVECDVITQDRKLRMLHTAHDFGPYMQEKQRGVLSYTRHLAGPEDSRIQLDSNRILNAQIGYVDDNYLLFFNDRNSYTTQFPLLRDTAVAVGTNWAARWGVELGDTLSYRSTAYVVVATFSPDNHRFEEEELLLPMRALDSVRAKELQESWYELGTTTYLQIETFSLGELEASLETLYRQTNRDAKFPVKIYPTVVPVHPEMPAK